MKNHIPTGAHYPGFWFTLWAWVWVWAVLITIMITKGCVGNGA